MTDKGASTSVSAATSSFRDEPIARNEGHRTASKTVAKLDNLHLNNLHIDALCYQPDGSLGPSGTRQRAIDPKRPTTVNVLESGFDATTASGIVVFEARIPDVEWEAMVADKELDCPKDRPQPLDTKFPDWKNRRQYEAFQRIDGSDPALQFKWRRFYVIDGNHRIWALKEVEAGRLHYRKQVTKNYIIEEATIVPKADTVDYTDMPLLV